MIIMGFIDICIDCFYVMTRRKKRYKVWISVVQRSFNRNCRDC